MSDRAHVEQLPYAQDRALVGGVKGKDLLFLNRGGTVSLCVAQADAFEIPRCPLTVAKLAFAPIGSSSAPRKAVHDVIDRIVDGRSVLRAVWWPGAWGSNGTIMSEEAVGVVMLYDAVRQAPTSEEWAAAAVDLRSLEGRVRP